MYKDSSDCLLLKWGSHAKALLKYSSTCPHERVAKVVREYNSLPEEKKQGQYTTKYVLSEHSPEIFLAHHILAIHFVQFPPSSPRPSICRS